MTINWTGAARWERGSLLDLCSSKPPHPTCLTHPTLPSSPTPPTSPHLPHIPHHTYLTSPTPPTSATSPHLALPTYPHLPHPTYPTPPTSPNPTYPTQPHPTSTNVPLNQTLASFLGPGKQSEGTTAPPPPRSPLRCVPCFIHFFLPHSLTGESIRMSGCPFKQGYRLMKQLATATGMLSITHHF